MIDLHQADPDAPRVYTVSRGIGAQPWVYFAGAAGLVMIALVGFWLTLQSRAGQIQMQMTTTVPMIFAVGLFATGIYFSRAPREVVYSGVGILVRFARREKMLVWGDIAWAEVQERSLGQGKVITVYGAGGKVLAKLPNNLERFEELAELVRLRMASQPSPLANAIRWRRMKRIGIGATCGAAFMLAGSVWTFYEARSGAEAARLLETQGVEADAVVVRKFVAPDGRTHRIEYRVADAGEKAKLHNVEIQPLVWEMVQEKARVKVRTVAGRPDIAKLAAGEVEDSMSSSPRMNYVLSAALLGMGIVFLVGAGLCFKGIDIGTDPVTGKFRVTRLPK